MDDFQSWVEWGIRERTFRNLAADLIRDKHVEEPTQQDYKFTIELLKRMDNFHYSPKAIVDIPLGQITAMGTFLSSPFQRFFINVGINDSRYSDYMKDVFLALEEPYRASRKQKEQASELIVYLADAVSKEMRRLSPDGNM